MRVANLLGDGAPTPLAVAARVLRALTAACNSAKHGEVITVRRQYHQNDRSNLLNEGDFGDLGKEAEQGSTLQSTQPGDGERKDESLEKECKYKDKKPKRGKQGLEIVKGKDGTKAEAVNHEVPVETDKPEKPVG